MGTFAGLGFIYRTVVYKNNSVIIPPEEFSENPFVACVTDNSSCCSETEGFWYYPSGRQVPSSHYDAYYTSFQEHFLVYYGSPFNLMLGRQLLDQNYQLSLVNFSSGIYHCLIPDRHGEFQNLFLGIYEEQSKCLFICN